MLAVLGSQLALLSTPRGVVLTLATMGGGRVWESPLPLWLVGLVSEGEMLALSGDDPEDLYLLGLLTFEEFARLDRHPVVAAKRRWRGRKPVAAGRWWKVAALLGGSASRSAGAVAAPPPTSTTGGSRSR